MSRQKPQPQMRILLADDDGDVRTSISNFLVTRGHHVTQAVNGKNAIEISQRERFDIVITDIKMPGADGFEILRTINRDKSEVEVIMMTGFGDIDMAVRAMRDGAFDFFSKPVKMQELSAAIERTERFHALRKERDQARSNLDRIHAEAHEHYGLSALIGGSPALQDVKNQVRQIAQTDATSVLITGETGTGKEIVARAIHHECARADGPFVAVDCTTIPDNLFESSFYGHEKGAFTDAHSMRKGHFEQADGGTLFLDEIGDMPLDMQIRMLRTLEERHIRRVGGDAEIPVNVRVISATNQDLAEAIAQNQFREELYHRINTFIIHLPPLRERPEDIVELAHHFLLRYAREMNKIIDGFTPDAIAHLQSHAFPGNVRELKNTIERAAILCQTERIDIDDLQFTTAAKSMTTSAAEPPSDAAQNFAQSLQSIPDDHLDLAQVEADVIREALRRCDGNKGLAADLLGLSRFALRRRISIHGIE